MKIESKADLRIWISNFLKNSTNKWNTKTIVKISCLGITLSFWQEIVEQYKLNPINTSEYTFYKIYLIELNKILKELN
jgi:hypothetical protein